MVYRTAALAACLALFACKGPEDTDITDVPTQIECETVSNQFPGDGSAAVYYRTSISWNFTAVDETAAVTLTGPNGAVAGTGSFTGNTYVWNPGTPLDPSTTYQLSLSFCGGEKTADTSFTTSGVGASTDVATLTGKTYLLDLTAPDVNFIEPPGVGSLLQAQLDGVSVLVGVRTANATQIDMIGAIGDDSTPPQQDLCTESIPFPLADFDENPYFEIGPEDTTITVAGLSVSIDDLKISGAFSPDQTVIAGAVLEGKVDTRPLVDLFAEGGADDAVCTLVGQFGVNCEDCGGGEVFCLSLKVNNINAEILANTTLVERTEATIAADAVCNPPPPAI